MEREVSPGVEERIRSPESLAAGRIRGNARIACGFCAIAVALLGGLVVVGWGMDMGILKRVLPGHVSMNPLTAVCFVIAAISLWLQREPLEQSRGASSQMTAQHLPMLTASVIFVVGGLVLLNYWLNGEIPLDQLLFQERLQNDLPAQVNRMAPNTAYGFILIGLALMLLNVNVRGHRPSEYFALATMLVALLALMGYVYSVQWFYGVPDYIPMAIHTAIGFLLLSLGVFLARPHEGLMSIVCSDSSGGILARRFIPAMLVVFALIGWLWLEGQRMGLYDLEMGVALHTILNVLIVGTLIWMLAKSFHMAESIREESRRKLDQLNKDLHLRAEQLTAANREIEAFSYSVSHDLRAPLRSISGFAEALEDHMGKDLDEEARDYLGRVRRAAKRMEGLIDDILKLSRLTRVEMKREQVNLSELASGVIKDLEEANPERKAEWKIDPDLIVEGDRRLLEAVLVNLLGNAWKFTSKTECPRIEFGQMEQDGERIFYVRDNGAGFDMRYADKLFGAFQRLHGINEFPGNGIGLATVARIVARHGGHIWAEGKENEGAVFYFKL